MTRALLIVDHGSRVPEAHQHLEWIARCVHERSPELRVYVAHMELAAPSIDEALRACVRDGAREVIVHPLFLVPGRHAKEDIPTLVQRAAEAHPEVEVRVTAPVGSLPEIAELILRTLGEESTGL